MGNFWSKNDIPVFQEDNIIISLTYQQKHVVGTHWKRLSETIPMGTTTYSKTCVKRPLSKDQNCFSRPIIT